MDLDACVGISNLGIPAWRRGFWFLTLSGFWESMPVWDAFFRGVMVLAWKRGLFQLGTCEESWLLLLRLWVNQEPRELLSRRLIKRGERIAMWDRRNSRWWNRALTTMLDWGIQSDVCLHVPYSSNKDFNHPKWFRTSVWSHQSAHSSVRANSWVSNLSTVPRE